MWVIRTARARSAEHVHAQIGRVDIDFDRVVDFRVDVDGHKRGVASCVGVKGALAHEAVNARFGAKRAVGPLALHVDRAALDAGHVAFGFFGELGGKARALGVAQIHALEHARPVLRFGAARARLNFDVAVGAVVGTVEHALEFELFNVLFKAFDFFGDKLRAVLVRVGHGHVEKFLRVFDARGQAFEAADQVFEHLLLFADFLRALGVVPERGVFNLAVDFFETSFLAVDVKDTP